MILSDFVKDKADMILEKGLVRLNLKSSLLPRYAHFIYTNKHGREFDVFRTITKEGIVRWSCNVYSSEIRNGKVHNFGCVFNNGKDHVCSHVRASQLLYDKLMSRGKKE